MALVAGNLVENSLCAASTLTKEREQKCTMAPSSRNPATIDLPMPFVPPASGKYDGSERGTRY